MLRTRWPSSRSPIDVTPTLVTLGGGRSVSVCVTFHPERAGPRWSTDGIMIHRCDNGAPVGRTLRYLPVRLRAREHVFCEPEVIWFGGVEQGDVVCATTVVHSDPPVPNIADFLVAECGPCFSADLISGDKESSKCILKVECDATAQRPEQRGFVRLKSPFGETNIPYSLVYWVK